MKQKLRLPRPSQAGKHTPPHDPSPRLPASSYAKCRCSKRGPLHISHQLRHSRVPSLHCDKSNCVPEDTRAVFSCLRTSIPDHWVSQICRAAEGSIAKRREGDGRISSRLNIISISVTKGIARSSAELNKFCPLTTALTSSQLTSSQGFWATGMRRQRYNLKTRYCAPSVWAVLSARREADIHYMRRNETVRRVRG